MWSQQRGLGSLLHEDIWTLHQLITGEYLYTSHLADELIVQGGHTTLYHFFRYTTTVCVTWLLHFHFTGRMETVRLLFHWYCLSFVAVSWEVSWWFLGFSSQTYQVCRAQGGSAFQTLSLILLLPVKPGYSAMDLGQGVGIAHGLPLQLAGRPWSEVRASSVSPGPLASSRSFVVLRWKPAGTVGGWWLEEQVNCT